MNLPLGCRYTHEAISAIPNKVLERLAALPEGVTHGGMVPTWS